MIDRKPSAPAVIRAFRVSDDNKVTEVELQPSARMGRGWYERARGCAVVIDTPHGDYFVDKGKALDVAAGRARYAYAQTLAAVRRAAQRMVIAEKAFADYNARF